MERKIVLGLLAAAAGLMAPAAARAEEPSPLQVFASVGPSAMDGSSRLSLGAGLSWSLSPSFALIGEVQHGRHRHEINTLSGSAGLRWRMLGSSRVSPFVLTSLGVVDYDSPYWGRSTGQALSLGGGLDARISARSSVFVESRINLWGGPSIGDGIDGHIPLRAGISLRF